ncbi:glycosyltransferase [Bdellovibrio bacteriovorus]|uniref:glycosyltransferase n=1 Tax=Bdellovibrio bacteriovorus TaxID=959 RepID=UPI0021CF50AA|nr:glycosyltransferase [Bdellovibrio bacteriovorus]UXR65306.1 glycosyltransferase [Bdellovibrio bacteriovorus]
MKIVFCLLSDQGHINPYIGPAQALLDRGHDVTVISAGNLEGQMKKAGIPFCGKLVQADQGSPRGRSLVEMIENRALHRSIIQTFFLKGIKEQVPLVQKWLKVHQPDVVVADPMNYAAIIAAHNLKLPWVSMSSSLTSVIPDDLQSDVLDIVRSLDHDRQQLFQSLGAESLRFRAVDCLSPWLNITFATKSFIKSPPAGVQLVGPSVPLRDRGDSAGTYSPVDGLTTIYVSFGSQVFYYPELFKKITAAVQDLPVHLEISIGDLIDEPGWKNTSQCRFYRYAPQLDILPQASLFITHGGANSIMEGLRAGTPLLVFPICNDQAHQAYFVEKSGTGQSINLRTAMIPEIRKAIIDMLENHELHQQVKAVAQDYQQNGSIKAAQLIEETMAI